MSKPIRSFTINDAEQAVYITERFKEGEGEPGTDTLRIDKKGLTYVYADGTLRYHMSLNEFLWLIAEAAVDAEDE